MKFRNLIARLSWLLPTIWVIGLSISTPSFARKAYSGIFWLAYDGQGSLYILDGQQGLPYLYRGEWLEMTIYALGRWPKRSMVRQYQYKRSVSILDDVFSDHEAETSEHVFKYWPTEKSVDLENGIDLVFRLPSRDGTQVTRRIVESGTVRFSDPVTANGYLRMVRCSVDTKTFKPPMVYPYDRRFRLVKDYKWIKTPTPGDVWFKVIVNVYR